MERLKSLIIALLLQKIMAKHPDPISSHVLDTASGFPAAGLSVSFEKYNEQTKNWDFVIRK